MTFDPFGDFETRGYLRNKFGEKDLAKVKSMEHHAFRSHVNDAIAKLRSSKPLTYQDVLATHRRLFHTVYPWAGQDRATNAPDLTIGKGGRFDLFAPPEDVPRATEYALSRGRNITVMRDKPGEIWGLLAFAHPFLDGNGRTIMVIHGELCRRAGLHIDWRSVQKEEWLAALTCELDEPGRHLDRFLEPYIRLKSVTAVQEAAALRSLVGLGPAAQPELPRPQSSTAASAGGAASAEISQARCIPEPQQPIAPVADAPEPTPPASQQVPAAQVPASPPTGCSPPLIPARSHAPLTREALHAAVIERDDVGRSRRLAMASAGAVFRDRQAALAEIDRRLIENPTDPTLISTALRSQPEQFGHFLGERRLGRDDAQRTRAKEALGRLASDVLAYGEAYHAAHHQLSTAHASRVHRDGIEVPAVPEALQPVLDGTRPIASLSDAERESLRAAAWTLRDPIEKRFTAEERSALARGDVTPLRLAGLSENLERVAALVTKVTTITADLAPKVAAEQAQTRQRGSALEP